MNRRLHNIRKNIGRLYKKAEQEYGNLSPFIEHDIFKNKSLRDTRIAYVHFKDYGDNKPSHYYKVMNYIAKHIKIIYPNSSTSLYRGGKKLVGQIPLNPLDKKPKWQ